MIRARGVSEMIALFFVSACVAAVLSAVTWWAVPRRLQSADPIWRLEKCDRWLAQYETRLSQADRGQVRDGVLRGETLPDGALRFAAFHLASALWDGWLRLRSARTVAVGALNMVLAAVYTCVTLTVGHRQPVWPFVVLGLGWLGGAANAIRVSRPRWRLIWEARAGNAPEPKRAPSASQIYQHGLHGNPGPHSGTYWPPPKNPSPLRTGRND